MKRRMSKKTIIFLALVMFTAALLGGCKKEETADSKYSIFYVNPEQTSLQESPYYGKMGEDGYPEQAVEDMLDSLKNVEDEATELSPIPEKVEVETYTLNDEKLVLYFNREYLTMDTVEEVFCRAALVRSLTQISGVDLVSFYVEDKPLTNSDGKEYGFMQAEDFVQNTGSSINSYQTMDVVLYFAGDSGNKLVKETISVRYNSSQAREKVIIERLMKGPVSDELHATIPKGTKLLGISIKDGVCYLNFDEGLKNATPGVTPEAVIYSIVNSVAESGTVSRVQIAINGETNIMFQESVKLGETLSRNLDIVEEE